ncbi:MAG: biosynthetic peptidoglycan transglycosylase, partial [Gemmatimonadales bacterium]
MVYDRRGGLLAEIGTEARSWVRLVELPAYVGQAFVATEDRRFYQHDGVDVIGLVGALRDNLLRGFGSRGASTITQQLIGAMYPAVVDRREITIGRKLREAEMARALERGHTKAEILEAYLNYIPFGHGWYGVEAAARHYFGKYAASLTVSEAAL